jgi:LEA14-like dessication related protein
MAIMRYLIASLLLFTTGCASLTTYVRHSFAEKPRVHLSSVRLSDLRSDRIDLQVALEVENPNSFPLLVDSVRYRVDFAGELLTESLIDQPIEVREKSKEIVRIEVPIRFRNLFSTLSNAWKTHSRSYRIKGEARIGPFTIPFDEEGELDSKKEQVTKEQG